MHVHVMYYFRSNGENIALPLQEHTYKLAMLMVLTRPSRSAELATLALNRRKSMKFTPGQTETSIIAFPWCVQTSQTSILVHDTQMAQKFADQSNGSIQISLSTEC